MFQYSFDIITLNINIIQEQSLIKTNLLKTHSLFKVNFFWIFIFVFKQLTTAMTCTKNI